MLIDELIEQHKDKKKQVETGLSLQPNNYMGSDIIISQRFSKITKKLSLLRFTSKFLKSSISTHIHLPDVQLEGRKRPLLPFFENRKKCPDFEKKDSDYVRPWVKFSIKNVVLRVSIGKNFKIFPAEKSTFKCPNLTKSPLPCKIFGCAPAFRTKSSSWISECCNLV